MTYLWNLWGLGLLIFSLSASDHSESIPLKTTTSSDTMGLTKEQINSIKLADEKLRALKVYCKSNQLNINDFLNKEQKKEFKGGLDFLDHFMPRVELAAEGELVTEDISKLSFLEAVITWKYNMNEPKLDSLMESHADVIFYTEKVVKNLGTSAYPISRSIYEEWKAIVGMMDEKVKGRKLFKELKASKTWKGLDWSNEKEILKHYKQNKAKYEQFGNDMGKFRDEIMPKNKLWELLIKNSTDSTDPNLPKVIVEKSKIIKENFIRWFDTESMQFPKEKPQEDTSIICSCLDPASSEVTYNIISESMKIELLQNIKDIFRKEIGDKKGAPWHDAKSYAITAMKAFEIKYKKEFDLSVLSIDEVERVMFPTNIANWMWNCSLSKANNKKNFSIKLKLVLKKVLKWSLSLTKKYGPSFKFNLDKLILKMENSFKIADNINIDDLIDINNIYNDIDNRIITTQEFHSRLEKTINNIIEGDVIDNYYDITVINNISDSVTHEKINIELNEIQDVLIKELTILIEKEKAKQNKSTKGKTSHVFIEGLKISYLEGTFYGLDLKLIGNIRKNKKGNYLFQFNAMDTVNEGGVILDCVEHLFMPTKVSVENGKSESLKIDFSLTFKYNKKLEISRISHSGFTVTNYGGGIGVSASSRFAKIFANLHYEKTNVSDSQSLGVYVGSPDVKFTEYFTLNLDIENLGKEIKLVSKELSFADKNYERVLSRPGESIELCGNTSLVII